MKKSVLTAFLLAVTSFGAPRADSATTTNAILAELYGRGVHAYYAGNYNDANQYLSMAIDNGIQDPRAYYFRGIVADASGRAYEAESDWQQGAEMEAKGIISGSIGQSLSRFQGPARMKLESIRQKARLQSLATAATRSQQRYGEIDAAQGNAGMAPAPPAAVPPAAVTPPPAPPVAENPFAGDMAQGQPKVVADDALEGAMTDPFADDAAAAGKGAAAAAGGADPFGGGAAGGADPFGGGAAGGADPFGGGGAAGGADPFGGGGAAGGADPFGGGAGGGNAGGAAEDPFGGNPFGS